MANFARKIALALTLSGLIGATLPGAAFAAGETKPTTMANEDILRISLQALTGTTSERKAAIDALVARKKLDIVPTLVLWLNISGNHVAIAEALETLTGEKLITWREAMLWQEAHPEIVPHPSYKELKLRYFASIDRNFVHSWHAGIHPACSFPAPARSQIMRWSGSAFGNPRLLHFHTCGAYAPGEISWNVIDPTINIDGVTYWNNGVLHAERLPNGPEILAKYPCTAAVFDQPDRDIGFRAARQAGVT